LEQYGLSLIAGSEAVLYVSLAAHACQFAFLVFFEEPRKHPFISNNSCTLSNNAVLPNVDIERTYGQRKPIAMRTPLPPTAPGHSDFSGSAVAEEGEEVNPFDDVARNNTPRPRKARVTSEASSADAPDSLADTPYASDGSNSYDTDTDSAAHTFTGGSNASNIHNNNNNNNRRPSVASSTMSEDLDAEYDAPAPNSYISSSDLSSRHTLFKSSDRSHIRSKHDFDAWYFRQDTIIFQNFDPLRATDFAFGLATVYLCAAFVLPYLSQKQQLVAVFINALLWRIGHTFVLGGILKAQSEKKWLVRHYLSRFKLPLHE
jgi:phosphatidylethanolamine N-methyltransferase